MLPPRIPFSAIVLCLAAAFLPASGRAQEVAAAKPDPQALLRAVRMTAALQDGDLQGEISNGQVKFPFGMSLAGGRIVFSFTQPDQQIALYIGDDTFRFTEKSGGGEEKPVPAQRQGEALRGTDITYEDLALRFLFWKHAEILGETELKSRQAWKMRIDNPGAPGPYAVVYAWIDKENPALLRVQGYNQQGRCVKQFEILSGMKVGDGWMLKEMRVETMDGATDKVVGRTYMRLEKPKERPKDGARPDW